jgi:hypothetical protein
MIDGSGSEQNNDGSKNIRIHNTDCYKYIKNAENRKELQEVEQQPVKIPNLKQ